MLKALVVIPNDKTVEYGSLLAVARHVARRREKSRLNPPIRSLVFVAELGIYLATYEVPDTPIEELKQRILTEPLEGRSSKRVDSHG